MHSQLVSGALLNRREFFLGRNKSKFYCTTAMANVKNRQAALKLGQTTTKCARCEKTVYFAEQIFGAGKIWHKQCLKCIGCSKIVNSGNLRDKDGEIYCSSCHTRSFGLKGYGYGVGSGVLSTDTGKAGEIVSTAPRTSLANPGRSGNGNACPRCHLVVYDAEKVRAVGKLFHKLCFKCASCGKGLTSPTMRDHNNEIYCRACYEINFAPKGYGFGQALSRT